jgi:NCS2 family nucleobase:cation symporter-2/xanthine permease XanP
MRRKNNITYAADERPPVHKALLLACTHIILIFDGIIFLPNILGKTTSAPASDVQFAAFGAIVVSALATLVQTMGKGGIGCGFVLFSGSYSAYLTCSLMAVKAGGFPLLGVMGLLSAPIMFAFAFSCVTCAISSLRRWAGSWSSSSFCLLSLSALIYGREGIQTQPITVRSRI